MKIIAVCPALSAEKPGDYQSLERIVRRTMETMGSITSISGRTAALAINWCERNEVPYSVTCDGIPGIQMSYLVERSKS